MLDSPMIDVTLGLMSFFLVMALSVTAIQGWISNLFGLRGKNLKKGLERLTGFEITKKIYDHPLMKTMGDNPSYLKSEYFSKIFIDAIASDKEALSKEKVNITELIEKIENKDLKKIFKTLNIKADDKIDQLEEKISSWFDTGMERASGWYQKTMQKCSIIISVILVISINADSLKIAQALYKDDALRAKANAIVDQISRETPKTDEEHNKLLQELKTQISITDFPVGWSEKNFSWNNPVERIKKISFWYHLIFIFLFGIIIHLIFILREINTFSWKEVVERIKNFSWKKHLIRFFLYGVAIWVMIIIFWSSIIGWLVTIFAISLGAPFWFDLIGKVANIRNSIKPKQKK